MIRLQNNVKFNQTFVALFGEGNGNPLQYSCLENSMDRGDLQVIVHGLLQRVRHDWATFTSLHFVALLTSWADCFSPGELALCPFGSLLHFKKMVFRISHICKQHSTVTHGREQKGASSHFSLKTTVLEILSDLVLWYTFSDFLFIFKI